MPRLPSSCTELHAQWSLGTSTNSLWQAGSGAHAKQNQADIPATISLPTGPLRCRNIVVKPGSPYCDVSRKYPHLRRAFCRFAIVNLNDRVHAFRIPGLLLENQACQWDMEAEVMYWSVHSWWQQSCGVRLFRAQSAGRQAKLTLHTQDCTRATSSNSPLRCAHCIR